MPPTTTERVAVLETRPEWGVWAHVPWRSIALVTGIISITLFGHGIGLVSTNNRLAGGIVMLVLGVAGLITALAFHALNLRRGHQYGQYLPWIPGGIGFVPFAILFPISVSILILTLIGIILLDTVTDGNPTYADLEFAGNNVTLQEVIRQWDRASMAAMGASAGFHLFAMAIYTFVLSLWHLRIATVAAERGMRGVACVANGWSPVALVMGTCYTNAHCLMMSLLVSRGNGDEAISRSITVFIYCFFILLGPSVICAIVLTVVMLTCSNPPIETRDTPNDPYPVAVVPLHQPGSPARMRPAVTQTTGGAVASPIKSNGRSTQPQR